MRVTEPPELTDWRETVTAFVESFGVDYFRACYAERTYPHDLYDAVVDRDWLGLPVDATHGGPGRSHVEQVVLLEALGRYGYDFGMPVLLATTGALTVARHGAPAQREQFLPRFFDGDVRFSIGVTEPGSGSDAAGLTTTATREADGYHVDGEKTYQSGAGVAGNHVACYARTDPESERRAGISLLLVPVDADGVAVDKMDLVSRRAVGTYDLRFDDVVVPHDHRVGDEGEGWDILSDHLAVEHTYMAAVMAGNAAEALDVAIDAVSERERFGRRVADFQTVKHRLADLHVEVESARLLVSRAASALDDGEGSRMLASQAKLKAGEVLKRVSSEAVHLLGGAGLDADGDAQRYWREGVSGPIAGATSEIHRSIVASALLSER